MTEWLVRKFVKNHDDVENPRVRTAYGTFASIVCIMCNIVLCAAPSGRQMKAFCTKPAMTNITKETQAIVMT